VSTCVLRSPHHIRHGRHWQFPWRTENCRGGVYSATCFSPTSLRRRRRRLSGSTKSMLFLETGSGTPIWETTLLLRAPTHAEIASQQLSGPGFMTKLVTERVIVVFGRISSWRWRLGVGWLGLSPRPPGLEECGWATRVRVSSPNTPASTLGIMCNDASPAPKRGLVVAGRIDVVPGFMFMSRPWPVLLRMDTAYAKACGLAAKEGCIEGGRGQPAGREGR
jgi:hypothetical protein